MNSDVMLEQYNSLVATLYRAPHSQEGWRVFLDQLLVFTNSQSGLLSIEDFHSGDVSYMLHAGLEEKARQVWSEHYFGKCPWIAALIKRNDNRFYVGDSIVPRKDYLKSELFNDWGKNCGVYHATGGYIGSPTNPKAIRIAFQQDEQQGPTLDEQLYFLNLLILHVQQALSLAGDIHPDAGTQTNQLIDFLLDPSFVCNENGVVLHKNAAAEELLCQPTSTIALQGGQLQLRDSRQNRRLSEIIISVASLAQPLRSTTPILKFSNCGQEHFIKVIPWITEEGYIPLAPQRVFVMIKPVKKINTIDKHDLRQIFGLSPREAQVAYVLAQGLSTKKLADGFNVAESTIRSHIKSILRKTDCNNQQKLVALLHSTSPDIN